MTQTKRFHFKVNRSKLDDVLTFHRQLNLVISRLIINYNLSMFNDIKILLDTMDDDILINKFTLRISFNKVKL